MSGNQQQYRAEGGRVDERQYYVPEGSRGDDFGHWPKGLVPSRPGYAYVSPYGREIARREYAARGAQRKELSEAMIRAVEMGQIKVNPEAWDYFLRTAPRSTNIEDRRYYDPTREEASAREEGGRIPENMGWR